MVFTDQSALAGTISLLADGGPWVASDLCLGSWRGHWIARELFRQLGLVDVDGQSLPPIGSDDELRDYAVAVGMLIDRESAGDHTRQSAHDHACLIVDALETQDIRLVIIVVPCFESAWEAEDIWLLHFLGHGVSRPSAGRTRILLVAPEDGGVLPPSLDINWIASACDTKSRYTIDQVSEDWALVPGLVGPRFTDGFISESSPLSVPCIQAPSGYGLVLPSHRRIILGRGNALRDANSNAAGWFKAYLEGMAPASCRDVSLLRREAACRFAEGGYNVALRLIEKAQESAVDEVERAGLESQAQSMRIAKMSFSAAASRDAPGASLPSELRRSLVISKAWGLAMTNRAEEAEPLFQLARDLTDQRMRDRLWLYLLNISAFNKLKLGKIEEAFAFEKQIEEELNSAQERDWHIFYINSINLARLYRTSNNLQKSREYFLKAFSINNGLRSESDQVYFNVCQARLERSQGNMLTALLLYFRAALHWLSLEVPEALASRVVRSMTLKGEMPAGDLVEPISLYLYEQIVQLSENAGAQFARLSAHRLWPGIVFRRVEAWEHFRPTKAIGCVGWGVLQSDVESVSRFRGEAYQRLADLIVSLITRLQPHATMPDCGTILTDTCFGGELPSSGAELLEVAIRHRVPKVHFEETEVSLTDALTEKLEEESLVEIAAGVSDLFRTKDAVVVKFKRYFQPAIRQGTAASLILMANETRRSRDLALELGKPHPEIMAEIRQLERDRIVRVTYRG